MNFTKRYRWMVLDHKGRLKDPPFYEPPFETTLEAEKALEDITPMMKKSWNAPDELVLITIYVQIDQPIR